MIGEGRINVSKGQAPDLSSIRASAERGDPFAQYELGQRYEHAVGLQRSLEEAAKWYRRATDLGNRNAQLNLAWMYDKGQGVSQDRVEAYVLYRLLSLGTDSIGTAAGNSVEDLKSRMSHAEIDDAERRIAAYPKR